MKNKFEPGKMYGLLHDPEGAPIVRVPRSVKVGIGVPAGRAVHVYIDHATKWCVRVGPGREAKVSRFETKDEARSYYREQVKTAGERKYPEKLPYFTFTRLGADGVFAPDWDVIEAHGALPTDIDVVFTSDEPLDVRHQMWTAAELKCEGDGINARRVLAMAANEEQKKLTAEASARGERYFPIVEGCRERGCPFARSEPPACKPHGRLRFQLLKAPSLGSEAIFDTTSFRSAAWLFSSLQTLRAFGLGHIAGVPVKLILRPFRVRHNGKTGTAYGVWIELRGTDVTVMKKGLIEAAAQFRALHVGMGPAGKHPALPAAPEEEEFVPPEIEAQAIHDEFFMPPEDDLGEPVMEDIQVEPATAPALPSMPRRKSATSAAPVEIPDIKEDPIPTA